MLIVVSDFDFGIGRMYVRKFCSICTVCITGEAEFSLLSFGSSSDGGEIIVPRRWESPRGLKNLFRKMNSGERI